VIATSGWVLRVLAKNAPECGDDTVGSVTAAFGLSSVPVNGVLIVIAALPT
jgi:hypothetical protein